MADNDNKDGKYLYRKNAKIHIKGFCGYLDYCHHKYTCYETLEEAYYAAFKGHYVNVLCRTCRRELERRVNSKAYGIT